MIEAIALGIDIDSDGCDDGRGDNTKGTYAVVVDAERLGKAGVDAAAAHDDTCFGFHEQPHQQAAHHKGQQQARRNGKVLPVGVILQNTHLLEVDLQEVVQHLAVVIFQGHRGAKTNAGDGPNNFGVAVRQDQPKDGHQRDNGERHVVTDGHLRALDVVEQQSVQIARDGGHRHRHQAGAPEAAQAAPVKLHGDGTAEQSAQNSNGKTEVQTGTADDGNHHGQHQESVHAHTHQAVGINHTGVNPQWKNREHQHQQKADDHQFRNAEIIHSLFDAIHTCSASFSA